MKITFVCEGGSVETLSPAAKLLLILNGSEAISLAGICSPVMGCMFCFPSILLDIPVDNAVVAAGLLGFIDCFCINDDNYCDPLCYVVRVVELIARLCSLVLSSSSSSSLMLLLKGLMFRGCCSGDY